MSGADVYAAGRLVGHVTRQPDSTTFTYAEGYDGPSLVPQLPVGTTTWPAGVLPPLLSNLLPEGRRLELRRQQVTTSVDNEVALLLAVGNDLVGDLQFVPEGTRPAESSAPQVDLDHLDHLDTVAFAKLRGMPVSSVPGVQDKVKVSERMSLPVHDTALSTHLLTFGQQGLFRLTANEHACPRSRARAGACAPPAGGLPVSTVEGVHAFDDEPRRTQAEVSSSSGGHGTVRPRSPHVLPNCS